MTTLGAAPYTSTPTLSRWERIVAWWRERERLRSMTAEERFDAMLAEMSPEQRERFIDSLLPPYLRRNR